MVVVLAAVVGWQRGRCHGADDQVGRYHSEHSVAGGFRLVQSLGELAA